MVLSGNSNNDIPPTPLRIHQIVVGISLSEVLRYRNSPLKLLILLRVKESGTSPSCKDIHSFYFSRANAGEERKQESPTRIFPSVNALLESKEGRVLREELIVPLFFTCLSVQ